MADTQTIDTYVIPLEPLPAQVVAVSLGNQACLLRLYTRDALYLDLSINGATICAGVACRDRSAIVQASYLGFQGELAFIDSQGASDPTYDGLGSRYNLVWLDY